MTLGHYITEEAATAARVAAVDASLAFHNHSDATFGQSAPTSGPTPSKLLALSPPKPASWATPRR